MNWGVIGTGNMGQVIVTALLEAEVTNPSALYVTNRTLAKAELLQKKYPKIHVVEEIHDITTHCDVVFLCVKPKDIITVLPILGEQLRKDQLLISITSAFSVEELEQNVSCQVMRLIPSITNFSLAGVSLLTFGERVPESKKLWIEEWAKSFSKPVRIEEGKVRIASDLVSCGPAFFAFLAEQYIKDADALTDLSYQEATTLLQEMFIGFGKLLEDGHFTLEELIEKVCVKGGITGEGIAAIEANGSQLFQHLIKATHDKFNHEKKTLNRLLSYR
ncbi:late competence protein ComER [Gracilibacillus halotolerans]|uniref:late competence protein ComER n=1 Tax=Gracilibacillus halotolerans TaxID=74386 RepID=UPI001616CA1C|nr:late competence protein ComER [Gracilibacillus halotolerans]